MCGREERHRDSLNRILTFPTKRKACPVRKKAVKLYAARRFWGLFLRRRKTLQACLRRFRVPAIKYNFLNSNTLTEAPYGFNNIMYLIYRIVQQNPKSVPNYTKRLNFTAEYFAHPAPACAHSPQNMLTLPNMVNRQAINGMWYKIGTQLIIGTSLCQMYVKRSSAII